MSKIGRYVLEKQTTTENLEAERSAYVQARRNGSSGHRDQQGVGHDMDGGGLLPSLREKYSLSDTGGAGGPTELHKVRRRA